MDKIRELLMDGNKYICVSLNLTSFIDTTAIRSIVTLFEDAKGSYICLSQCRPRVVELIRRYQRCSAKFPANVKTFVSTHDAVKYLQQKRSQQQSNENDDEWSQDLSLTKNKQNGITKLLVSPPPEMINVPSFPDSDDPNVLSPSQNIIN